MRVLFPLIILSPSALLAKLLKIVINKSAASFSFVLFTERVDLLKIESFWKAHNQILQLNYTDWILKFFYNLLPQKDISRLYLLRYKLFMKFFFMNVIQRPCFKNTWEYWGILYFLYKWLDFRLGKAFLHIVHTNMRHSDPPKDDDSICIYDVK